MRNEKIIVIRCFEKQKKKEILHLYTKQRVKCLIRILKQKLHSHLQTKSPTQTHAHQYTEIRVFTTDHIVYTYIYSILLVVKVLKREELKRKSEQTKIVVKKKYFQPNLFVLYLSVIVSKPSKTH